VKLVEELGLPDLTTEQIETLCEIAEKTARKHVLLKVPSKMVEKLDISVAAEGTKPLNLTVEIDLVLSPKTTNLNADTLVNEAIKEALEASDNYLRKQK
jgi:post-segregation antitoxin (ccd killing protein)